MIGITSLLAIAVIAFVLRVRPQDVPPPEKPSPFAHLDERKAAIYDGLRDLQFEYRLGKLSDEDYQSTKTDLQKQLAAVLAEVDRIKSGAAPEAPKQAPEAARQAPSKAATARICPHCGAKFERELKFCGECGKAMTNA
jgi:NADH pyrophosphatase NudC (nudix superfamily)